MQTVPAQQARPKAAVVELGKSIGSGFQRRSAILKRYLGKRNGANSYNFGTAELIFYVENQELCFVYRILIMVVALAVLAACGGNVSRAPATTPPASTPPSSTGGSAAPVTTPAIVTVAASATASGVNITVGPAAGATPSNAQNLGVAGLTGSASAFNTGATISRGATQRVVLFGPGLTGDMQVTIRGPSDIQVSNVVAITSTDKTPGISFTAAVAANAALGARSVVLQASNGDITTFTGGLEVVP